jgi:adenylosuccinate synthase
MISMGAITGLFNPKVIIGMVFVAAFAAGYIYYKDTQATIIHQAQTIATQSIAIEQSKLIQQQQVKDAKQQSIISAELSKVFVSSRKEVDELREKFDKINNVTQQQRDIGKLAVAKSARIQKIINNGTGNILRCFELVSGAEHTAGELAATKKSESNNECISIANPNITPK